MPEVRDPPAHLRAEIALVAQREDGVAVPLGDRATSAAVGLEDAFVHVGMVGF